MQDLGSQWLVNNGVVSSASIAGLSFILRFFQVHDLRFYGIELLLEMVI